MEAGRFCVWAIVLRLYRVYVLLYSWRRDAMRAPGGWEKVEALLGLSERVG